MYTEVMNTSVGTKTLNANRKSTAEALMLVSRSILYVTCAQLIPSHQRLNWFSFVHMISSLICSTSHWMLWKSEFNKKNEKISDYFPQKDIDGNWFDQAQIQRLKAFCIINFRHRPIVICFIKLLNLKNSI